MLFGGDLHCHRCWSQTTVNTEVRRQAALSGHPAGDVEQKQTLPFRSRTPGELYQLETWPSGSLF